MKFIFLLILFIVTELISCHIQSHLKDQYALSEMSDKEPILVAAPLPFSSMQAPSIKLVRRRQCFFKKWVKGSLVSANNQFIKNDNYGLSGKSRMYIFIISHFQAISFTRNLA